MLKPIVQSFASLILAMPAAAQCLGDVTQDGIVSGTDLAAVLSAWGTSGQGDFDNDGVVGGTDLTVLLGAWGACVQVPAWATLIEAAPNQAVVYDEAQRAAIIATGFAWRVKDTATQIEFVLIPPGTFNMGCTPSQTFGCESFENPVHSVTLTQTFYMSRYEITQAQWQARMGSNPSFFQGFADAPSRPVEQVSWSMIQGFLTATGFRLPTEAEWEYAYRAGTTTAFHGWPTTPNGTSADGSAGTVAWYFSISASQTHPVCQKVGNGLGLHDMGGNVWECVTDWFALYGSAAAIDPQGPTSGFQRVIRGGGWDFGTDSCRASRRYGAGPTVSWNALGFRAAKAPF